MRDEIKNKLNDHIKELLSKPSISNEDYVLLREKLSELPPPKSGSTDWMLPILLMMIFSDFGGGKNEL